MAPLVNGVAPLVNRVAPLAWFFLEKAFLQGIQGWSGWNGAIMEWSGAVRLSKQMKTNFCYKHAIVAPLQNGVAPFLARKMVK